MRRRNFMVRATKNPPRLPNKLTYAPDAVSREYRGKIVARKEYFTPEFVLTRDCAESLRECKRYFNFLREIENRKRDAAV
jgi:hypothetical protein